MTGEDAVRRNVGAPRLLDLFCCEGGASEGYARAGFDVYGVDLFEDYSQKRYPFPSTKGDAIEFVKEHGHEFDVIAASPPCQHASAGTRAQDRSKYPRLIEPTREALIATGKPYVIENVRGSDLIDPIELCGCMFDMGAVDTDGIYLHLQRVRRFECSMAGVYAPRPCDHSDHEWVGGSYGGARRDKYEAKHVRHGGYVPAKEIQQALLGIDWMTERGMHQAIPPAYTEYLGRRILQLLGKDSYRNGVRHSPNCASFMGLYCSRECAEQNRPKREVHRSLANAKAAVSGGGES